MIKVKEFFISIGRWFKGWVVSLDGNDAKFVQIGKGFKRFFKSIGLWFASWFVSVNDERAKFVSVGLWFKNWLFTVDGKRPKFVSIGLWFKNWFCKVDGQPNKFVKIGRWFKSFFVATGSTEPRLKTMIKGEGSYSILSAAVSIVIGLLVGLLILVCINPAQSFQSGFIKILLGGFNGGNEGMGLVIANAAPLIMVGLAVGFAFKTGLFNIGAAGQYTVGAFGGLLFAIVLRCDWWVCLIMATLFGAVWGAIPGIFKALLNVNEVITSIMFNWIGLRLVNELMYGDSTAQGAFIEQMYDLKQSKTYVLKSYFPQSVIPNGGLSNLFGGTPVTIAIFLAVAMALIIWVVLNKTTFGYELKACGNNRSAAKYAGINEKRSIILSMTISGALAGFGAGLYYLSGVGEWSPQNNTALPAMGFNGIAVALLASNSPIGIIFSAVFIQHITRGGSYVSTQYFSRWIADVICGVIVYLCAFNGFIKSQLKKLFIRKKDKSDQSGPAKPAKIEPTPKDVELEEAKQ